MGSTMIYWTNRKQDSIAQSTSEAEYIATSYACKEAVWLRKLISDLFEGNIDSTIIHTDNQSYIKLSVIEMRFHFIIDLV